MPSRFLDELPEAHVEVKEPAGGSGGFGMSGYGASRFDETNSFGSNYTTPGWQRAQARKGRGRFQRERHSRVTCRMAFLTMPPKTTALIFTSPRAGRGRRAEARVRGRASPLPAAKTPLTIEGELVAKSTGATSSFAVGERVFHQKFGNGNVTAVDGNKLTIKFDKAGEKRVVDSFVERV